jgi:ABC-2 type transport system ATP-binding protein
MSDYAIEVSGLTKRYENVAAVQSASFSVPRGTICGFVGPNGAGKTTTIRMLLGLIAPTSGTGTVLGHSITEPEKYLASVGAMIEGPAFYPALTGEENLKVLATMGGIPIERVSELIDRVGLAGRGGDKYKTYSLGMKQRLGIAAALLPNPELLILDEPTNGLDPEGIQEVRDLLNKLSSEGTTVFVSSHLLSEIENISRHIVMVRKGEVVFAGAIEADIEKIAAIAQGEGHHVSIRHGEAHIEGPHEYAATLNKLAFQAGIVLSQLTPTLPNLEETFFEMTGGQS